MTPVHRHLVRVRFPEIDVMGWAHHGVYFTWFEIGRTELLRSLGFTYRRVMERGCHLPVVEAGCRYRRPVRYDDILAVETRVVRLTPIQIRFQYQVRIVDEEELHAEGFTRHAVVGPDGKLRKLPDDILALLAPAVRDIPGGDSPPPSNPPIAS